MMVTYSGLVHGINLFASADESLGLQVQMLFDLIRKIPDGTIYSGYKLEIGFSVFFFSERDEGYYIFAPNYTGSPFVEKTEDLTIALWVMMEQAELLRKYNIDGVSCRFDDQIVVAKGALTNRTVSLQRFSDMGKNASGWCVESIEKKADGTFYTNTSNDYESLYAYQLLLKRPSIIKALVCPFEFIVIFDGDEITEILNEKDESLILEE